MTGDVGWSLASTRKAILWNVGIGENSENTGQSDHHYGILLAMLLTAGFEKSRQDSGKEEGPLNRGTVFILQKIIRQAIEWNANLYFVLWKR